MCNFSLHRNNSNNIKFKISHIPTLQKSKLCKSHRFSNVVKIMIFSPDVQNYVPIKLCKAAGSIHLFKITGMLKAENIKLNQKLFMGHFGDRLEGIHSDF